MDFSRLQIVERIGGTLLQAPGAIPLIIAERIARHGAPQVLALFANPQTLEPVLDVVAALHAQGLDLNLIGLIDPGAGLAGALQIHRRRLGALLCALDACTPWPGDSPMLAKRLPGLIRSREPLPLADARLSPLERSQLRDYDPSLSTDDLETQFVSPAWSPSGGHWLARLWPGVALPDGAETVVPGFELQTAAPFADALRSALRAESGRPVPFLPLAADPSRLQALGLLCPEVQIFQGSAAAWTRALAALAQLPAPPHFCARC